MTPTAVIDAHQHFWSEPSVAQYPWMTGDFAALRKSFLPADLAPLLAANGVDGTVAVQSRSSLEESRWLLETAAESSFVLGVVGWVDLTGPDVEEQISSLRQAPGGHHLVGIRHQVHDEDDPGWLRRPDVQAGLRAVEAAGLVYDLLVREQQLPAALETAQALPSLRFVIDHIAKPKIAAGPADPGWEAALRPFAELDNVACKLSGMVTEADWGRWRPEDLVPYVDKVLGWFGQDRLLFGSDWPVSTLAAGYEEVILTARSLLGGLPPAALQAIFGGNAARLYRLQSQAR